MVDGNQNAAVSKKHVFGTLKKIFMTDLPQFEKLVATDSPVALALCNLPRLFAEVVLIAYAVYNTYLITDSASDSIKNTLFYKACIAIMLVVILAGRVRIISARLVPEAGFCYTTYMIFKKVTGYTIENAGADYYPSCVWKILVWDIALLLVFEIIVHKRFRSVKNVNWWFAGLVVISTLYSVVVDIKYLNYYVLPVLVLYLIELEKNQWREICDALAWGFIAGGGVLFAKSFIEVPLAEDKWYKIEKTYFGIFLDTENSGALAAGMMVCAIYIVVTSGMCKKTFLRVLRIFAGVGIILVTSVISALICNFTGIVGTVFAVAVLIVAYCFKKNWKLGTAIVLAGITIAVAAYSVLWKMSADAAVRYRDTERTEPLTKFETRIVVLQGSDFISEIYVVSDSELVNALNRITSGRVGIWKHYMQQITTWGAVPQTDENGFSTHSACLYWLVRFGIVGGCLFILRFIYCWAASFAGVFHGDRHGSEMILLWMAFLTAFFLSSATSIVWQCMCSVYFLLLGYPFMGRQNLTVIDSLE